MAENTVHGTGGRWSQLVVPPREIRESFRLENRRLRRENRSLREQVGSLRKKLKNVDEHREIGETVADVLKFFEQGLRPAMQRVARFATERADKLQRVILAVTDNQIGFLFILKAQAFDWDMADQAADLQTELLDADDIFPVSCSIIPGGFNNEQYLSRATLSTYTPAGAPTNR